MCRPALLSEDPRAGHGATEPVVGEVGQQGQVLPLDCCAVQRPGLRAVDQDSPAEGGKDTAVATAWNTKRR